MRLHVNLYPNVVPFSRALACSNVQNPVESGFRTAESHASLGQYVRLTLGS